MSRQVVTEGGKYTVIMYDGAEISAQGASMHFLRHNVDWPGSQSYQHSNLIRQLAEELYDARKEIETLHEQAAGENI